MQITQDLSHAEKQIYAGNYKPKDPIEDASFAERLKLAGFNVHLPASPTNSMQLHSRLFDFTLLELLELKSPYQVTASAEKMDYRVFVMMADTLQQKREQEQAEENARLLELKKKQLERTLQVLTYGEQKKLTATGRPVCIITAFLSYHPWVFKKKFSQTLRGDKYYSDPRKMIDGLRGTIRQRWKELNFARIYCNSFKAPDDVIFEARISKITHKLEITVDRTRQMKKHFS